VNQKAVCDIPPAAFAEELIAAYPDAKVVIVNRDVDSWYKSMEKTVLSIARPTFSAIVWGLLDWRQTGQVGKMLDQVVPGVLGPRSTWTEAHVKRVYIEYHENLRRIVPEERRLEFKLQDGYPSLCEFLGVPVPTSKIGEKEVEESFPKINEGSVFSDRVFVWRRLARERALKKLATFASVSGLVVGVLWYMGGLEQLM
jgi:hypothetical protein